MLRLILALIALFVASGPVLADAIDDARAALEAQNNDDLEEALRLYTVAIQSHELNTRYLAIAYYNRGNVYFAGGDYRAAIADYDSAAVVRPEYAQAHNNRGNAYVALGAYREAVAAFNQAIYIEVDYALAYKNRGNAHTGAGFFERAIADYDMAIAFAPDLAKAYNNRANAKYFLGRFGAAVDDYEAALEIDPFDIYSMLWRYLAAVRTDAAADGFQALRSRLYDVEQDRWPAVVARHFIGRATAAAVLAEIDAVAPEERLERRCEAYFYLGAARLIAGDREAAERLFRVAIATDVRRFVEFIGAAVDLERMGHTSGHYD